MEDKIIDRFANLDISEPKKSNPFEAKDLASVAKLLSAGYFQKIALMIGAGVSVNAGIPDFRSKGGLYESLKKKGFPKPEIVFDINLFKDDPTLFYEVGSELDLTDKTPTLTHYFFRLLEKKGILLKLYTQNIDSLELRAGVSRNKIMQAHGHFDSAHCINCRKQADIRELKKHLKNKTVYKCIHCGRPVKPDVVFFGEKLPAEFYSDTWLLEDADLLIVIGTSLVVHPFASLVDIVRRGTPRILINKYIENANSFKFNKEEVPDLAFEGDCDEILKNLADLCGWSKELNDLIANVSYLGALDFGTGSTRFIVYDNKGRQISKHQIDLSQHFPSENMHEQDPLEYITGAQLCIEQACKGLDVSLIKGIGITNQRETIVCWDRNTGMPLYNAIIWDDARTADICNEFSKSAEKIKEKTGLPLSTYFSASKIVWLIRNVPSVSKAVLDSNCMFGTVETWAIYKLTKEKKYLTDVSNASRTMLMNLKGYWDEELLDLFGIPLNALGKIVSCAEEYGKISTGVLENVPITGAIGDQQSALLGHHCFDKGDTKCTYGTGAFLLMSTGYEPQVSNNGLITTVYGRLGEEEEIQYALEGSVECAGSLVKWMMNQLGFFSTYEELETLAASVPDAGGVYFVPSLSGIFAPYWKSDARGMLTGISQHTTKAHIIRSILEGVCFRTAEIINALSKDSNVSINTLSVDGGMTNNKLFVQLQADISGISVEIPQEKDLTALGAAYAAGIGSGVYRSVEDIKKIPKSIENVTKPAKTSQSEKWVNWKDAISRCLLPKS